jgi:2'-5' RNA ligase
MTDKRIFLAIPLSQSFKNQIYNWQSQWPKFPIRWAAKGNLHVTLLFLGQKRLEEVARISELIYEIAQVNSSFFLLFKKVQFQPNINQPTTLWLRGEENLTFSKLVKDLENILREEKLYFPAGSIARKQIPHITLGRINRFQWRQLELEERPEVEKEIFLKIPVKEIALFESKLHRQGPEYITLEKASLS